METAGLLTPSDFDDRVKQVRAGTHALVDLDRLAGNVGVIRRDVLPPGAELMAVVKANAYGHGYVPVARAVLEAGARSLVVARIEEGLLLRREGITAPVLVVGPPNPALARHATQAGLALTVGSRASVAAIAAQLDARAPVAHLHLKIDTGMRRFGTEPAEAAEVALAIARDPRLHLEGVFTHFATADEADTAFLDEQLQRFAETRRRLASVGLEPPQVHVANSAAALRGLQVPGLTAIRMGIAIYGLSPSPDVAVTPAFRPAIALKSRVGRVFTLQAGEGVSYGLTWVAPHPARCATLPVGYGDGLSRSLSNRGWAGVGGRACPIRGRVCMDQTLVEVGEPGVAEGDEAILIGDGAGGEMTADQAAVLAGTISYEVICAISARVPRLYLQDGRPVGIHDLGGFHAPGADAVWQA